MNHININHKMGFRCILVLLTFVSSCQRSQSGQDIQENQLNRYVIDTSEFLSNAKLFRKIYWEDGILEVTRLYEDSIPKDLARFYRNGYIEQYVFFNETLNTPKCILNYDSAGIAAPTLDGKLAYFKSTVFGKNVEINNTYSVYLYCATPPRMRMKVSLFSSPDKASWETFAVDYFNADKNSVTIFDTASISRRNFMAVCALMPEKENSLFTTDTIYYSLNLK